MFVFKFIAGWSSIPPSVSEAGQRKTGLCLTIEKFIAGWSSPVARQAHNLKVVSSNLAPATKLINNLGRW